MPPDIARGVLAARRFGLELFAQLRIDQCQTTTGISAWPRNWALADFFHGVVRQPFLTRPQLPERHAEGLAEQATLLMVVVALVDLAFGFPAVDGVAQPLKTMAKVEHEVLIDLIFILSVSAG